LNEALQGKILQALLEGVASTSQLAQFTRARLSTVRRELIHLHHLLVIRIVAVRSVEGGVPAESYYRDYVWEITRHGMEHASIVSGCKACEIRSERLLLAGGFI
jgi:hypothetical protein